MDRPKSANVQQKSASFIPMHDSFFLARKMQFVRELCGDIYAGKLLLINLPPKWNFFKFIFLARKTKNPNLYWQEI